MTFTQLRRHIEPYGALDPLIDEGYLATNCINAETCVIEELSEYDTQTLCHYFYELGIPAPKYMRTEFYKYCEWREQLDRDGQVKMSTVEQRVEED